MTSKSSSLQTTTSSDIEQQQIDGLSIEVVRTHFCKLANDIEIRLFIELCKARRLNPWVQDAYLVKYAHNDPAQMVVGKDLFLKRADGHEQFDGFRAGIIVGDRVTKKITQREGAFRAPSEQLLGGWAEVYRKDRKIPFRDEVGIEEYEQRTKEGKVTRMWAGKSATMIRKVALMQALREAFPEKLGKLYDSSEMGVELPEAKEEAKPVVIEAEVEPEPAEPDLTFPPKDEEPEDDFFTSTESVPFGTESAPPLIDDGKFISEPEWTAWIGTLEGGVRAKMWNHAMKRYGVRTWREVTAKTWNELKQYVAENPK